VKFPVSDRLWPWLLLVSGLGVSFVLACRLSGAMPENAGGEGVAARLLGEGRRAVSVSLGDMAELYFHKGVERQSRQAITNNWFLRRQAQISPRLHRHTQGGGNAEVLPWLRMAVSADPHNVEAHLVLAFWLATGIRRPDLAAKVLADAQRSNPDDYRIFQEQGRMAIHEGRFSDGRRKLETAMGCWPSGLGESRETLLDKAEGLCLLGLLCEDAGEPARAEEYYKNTLAIFPERAYIRERLAMLRDGRAAGQAARDALRLLVRRTTDHACSGGRESHEDHDDHEHDDHDRGE